MVVSADVFLIPTEYKIIQKGIVAHSTTRRIQIA
jgi:hypothetical protein